MTKRRELSGRSGAHVSVAFIARAGCDVLNIPRALPLYHARGNFFSMHVFFAAAAGASPPPHPAR
jgi:hypothetical protein